MEKQEFVATDLLGLRGAAAPCSASPISRISLIIALLGRTSSTGPSLMVTWTGVLQLLFPAHCR